FAQSAPLAAPALRNIAVVKSDGSLSSALYRPAIDFLPLPRGAAAAATQRRILIAGPNAVVIAFPVPGGATLIELDTRLLLPRALLGRSALATSSGQPFAYGERWNAPFIPLPTRGQTGPESTLIDGHILVSAARVEGWPALVATSLDTGDALAAWY